MADNDKLLGETLNNNNNTDDGNQTGDNQLDYLDLLVGDGKKYTDAAGLAKAYAHIQDHTNTVQDENAKLRQELDAAKLSGKTVDDVLSAIQGSKGNQHHDDTHDDDDDDRQRQALTKDDVVRIITGAFDQRDKKSDAQHQVDAIEANQKVTWDKLSEIYGDKQKAMAAVSLYAGNDPGKKALVQELGSYDTDTLVKIMQTAVPPTGEQIDFGLQDTGNENNDNKQVVVPQGLFTYAQAEVIRKKDPRKYNSREFQSRLHTSCDQLGDKFWIGTKRQKK